MKIILRKIGAPLILLLLSVVSAYSAPVVKADLDSNVVMMGKFTTLRLTVNESNRDKGRLLLFEKLPERGFVGVCGDSVELRMPSKIDTTVVGNNRKIIYTVPVQSFDSGAYVLPKFVYVSGKDSSFSNQVALKVIPVNVSADDQINDYANVADPEDPSIFDVLPDWVIDYWWLILIVLLCIAVLIYALLKYKKQGYIIPKKPEPTPYEEAITSLRNLKERKLWEQGMDKDYYTDLTEILRKYLYRRFGINAMEMTTRQILTCLGKNPETNNKRAYFRKILDMADFVKFAKIRPLPDDNVMSFDNAVRFVEETKPVPVAEEKGDKK